MDLKIILKRWTKMNSFHIIIKASNEWEFCKCPIDCEYYDNNDYPYYQACLLDNGIFEIKNDLLIKCPINKW